MNTGAGRTGPVGGNGRRTAAVRAADRACSSPAHAARRRFDEGDEALDLGNDGELGPHAIDGLAGAQAGLEHDPIGALEGLLGRRRHAAALEADRVEAVQGGTVAGGVAEGWDVL